MLKLKLQYFGHLVQRMTPWKRQEILNVGGEGDNRGWDGWMASPTQWTWVWASSGSWWRTGKPGVLQFMGSQRVGQDWVTELNWTSWIDEKPKLVIFLPLKKYIIWKSQLKCHLYIPNLPLPVSWAICPLCYTSTICSSLFISTTPLCVTLVWFSW